MEDLFKKLDELTGQATSFNLPFPEIKLEQATGQWKQGDETISNLTFYPLKQWLQYKAFIREKDKSKVLWQSNIVANRRELKKLGSITPLTQEEINKDRAVAKYYVLAARIEDKVVSPIILSLTALGVAKLLETKESAKGQRVIIRALDPIKKKNGSILYYEPKFEAMPFPSTLINQVVEIAESIQTMQEWVDHFNGVDNNLYPEGF